MLCDCVCHLLPPNAPRPCRFHSTLDVPANITPHLQSHFVPTTKFASRVLCDNNWFFSLQQSC